MSMTVIKSNSVSEEAGNNTFYLTGILAHKVNNTLFSTIPKAAGTLKSLKQI